MSADWPLVTINEIQDSKKGSIAIGPFGSRMKADCYVNDGIPVIRGTNITGGASFKGDFVYITKEKSETLGSSNVYQNDLVFPHRGAIGEVGIILEKAHYVISSSLMKLTCDQTRVNPKFLYYFFKSRIGRHELLKNASQVGTPGIGQPLTSLKSIEFRLPPLETQNKIEILLSSLERKIELNRKMNQTLEEMAQALFKSWFVDFDPVHVKVNAAGREDALGYKKAKATNEADLEQIAKELGISKEVLDLFPDEFEESELGMIPKGWESKTLGDLTNITSSKRIFSREYEEDGVPFYRSKEIISLASGNAIEDTLYISQNKFSDIKGKFLVPKKNDILITSVGTIGIIYLVPDNSPFYFKDGNLTWINDYNNIHHLYIYHFLKSQKTQNRIKSVVIGTTQKALTIVNINSLSVITPSINILESFSKQAEAIFNQITINTNLTHSLQKTRDTLLPKLLSGELDVSELNLEVQ